MLGRYRLSYKFDPSIFQGRPFFDQFIYQHPVGAVNKTGLELDNFITLFSVARRLHIRAQSVSRDLWKFIYSQGNSAGLFESRFYDERDPMPLIFLTKDPENVIVSSTLSKIAPWSQQDSWDVQRTANICEKFFESVKADLKDPNKSKKWSSPKKIISNIKRHQVMSWGKFLKSLPNYKASTPDHVLRDIVERIKDLNKPMEMHIGSSMEDWRNAYTQINGSCMGIHATHTNKWWEVMQKGDVPTDFYSYLPKVKIATLRKGAGIIARATVILDDEAKKAFLIRAYPGDTEIYNKFLQRLKKDGWHLTGNKQDTFRLDAIVKVPAKPAVNDLGYYAPMPYIDCCSIQVGMEFDDNEKMFTFNIVTLNNNGTTPKSLTDWVKKNDLPEGVTRNFWIGNTARGFTYSWEAKVQTCVNCRGTVTYQEGTRPILIPRTGKIACSESCARSQGYVYAYRADGSRAWDHTDDCIEDPFVGGLWYANEHSMSSQRDMSLYRDDYISAEEDLGLTMSRDNKLRLANDKIAVLSNDAYRAWSRSGVGKVPVFMFPDGRISIKHSPEIELVSGKELIDEPEFNEELIAPLFDSKKDTEDVKIENENEAKIEDREKVKVKGDFHYDDQRVFVDYSRPFTFIEEVPPTINPTPVPETVRAAHARIINEARERLHQAAAQRYRLPPAVAVQQYNGDVHLADVEAAQNPNPVQEREPQP